MKKILALCLLVIFLIWLLSILKKQLSSRREQLTVKSRTNPKFKNLTKDQLIQKACDDPRAKKIMAEYQKRADDQEFKNLTKDQIRDKLDEDPRLKKIWNDYEKGVQQATSGPTVDKVIDDPRVKKTKIVIAPDVEELTEMAKHPTAKRVYADPEYQKLMAEYQKRTDDQEFKNLTKYQIREKLCEDPRLEKIWDDNEKVVQQATSGPTVDKVINDPRVKRILNEYQKSNNPEFKNLTFDQMFLKLKADPRVKKLFTEYVEQLKNNPRY